ncbi:biogenesis of lysosomal organelles complex 1 subunit pallidin [Arctopsyche grandis]|uniref:biogenesis of lysosomal organelles complex 1 subunit pallidin n=1 Tax=Arctopsyche grandis TaxID=121162 RepID=UPI00406DA32C
MDATSEPERIMSEQDIEKLSKGLLDVFQEPLVKVATNLNELTTKQKALIDIVDTKNQQLQCNQNSEEMKKMFSDIIGCRDQLTIIKKQMTLLHERSSKLKVRAQNVVSNARKRHAVRLAQLDKEQRLIGGNKS